MSIERIYVRIGAQVRRLREERGLTQAAVGAALRPPLTRAGVSNIEAANQRLMLHTALQLAEMFHVELEELVNHRHRFITDEDGAVHPCACGARYVPKKKAKPNAPKK